MSQRILLLIAALGLLVAAGILLAPSLVSWWDVQASDHTPFGTDITNVSNPDAELPDAARMEQLAQTDPIAFLEHCERKYDQTVTHGYRMTMQKQELLSGKLGNVEIIDVAFREKPYSVQLRWKAGAGMAAAALYVEHENKGKILVQPAPPFHLAGIQERDPEGSAARQSGRFPLTQFGLKKGLQRTRATWVAARDENDLYIEYRGQQRLKEANDRLCYVFHRGPYKTPDRDGVTDLTIWIDVESWLQVGVLSRGAQGQLIGEYYFRDIRLNPEFTPDPFTREALKP